MEKCQERKNGVGGAETGKEECGAKVNWVDSSSIFAVLAYVAAAAWFIWQCRKEKNPQDYVSRHILTIELWIISIFIMTVMRKVTILIVW